MVPKHPPPPETYLLFCDVFAVSTPFVLDLELVKLLNLDTDLCQPAKIRQNLTLAS